MLQPYFLAKLVRQGDRWVGVPTKTLKAKYIAPPEKK